MVEFRNAVWYIETNMIGEETKKFGAKSSFAALFATPTLARLLTILTEQPGRRFIQKELVELSGSSLYLVQRELKRLESVGIISREPRGRQVEYQANTAYPAFAGLKSALAATLGLAGMLEGFLRNVPSVQLAFIFGSVAEGTEEPESDLDLFVIGDMGLREISQQIMPGLRDVGREPNIVTMTAHELRERYESGDNFVCTVVRGPKVWLVGDDEGLAAIFA